jgi:hypothetical protein
MVNYNRSRDSSAGIAIGYGLQGRVSNPERGKTGSEAQPASYQISTGRSFPCGKAGGGVKLTTDLHLVLRSRKNKLYL